MKAMISHLPWVCGCGETEFSLETHLGHKWGLETRVVGAKTSSNGLNNSGFQWPNGGKAIKGNESHDFPSAMGVLVGRN